MRNLISFFLFFCSYSYCCLSYNMLYYIMLKERRRIGMPYSNNRKLALSGWLKSNDAVSYGLSLKLQKFLFLYEAFSKISDDNPDFSCLKGYQRGPVFSTVWGDYTRERKDFDRAALSAYNSNIDIIDEQRAKKVDFIIGSLSESDLSELTHGFNIWRVKSKQIMAGEQHVELDEADFNDDDIKMTMLLERMYPDEMINHSVIIPISEKYFVFSENDMKKFTEQHMDILIALAKNKELHNPVFVEIEDDGRLSID